MRRKGIVTTFCGLIVLCAVQAHAQSSQADQYIDRAAGVSLSGAVAMAIAREPSLAASRTQLDVARGMQLQAGLRPNPIVLLEQRQQPGATDNQSTVGVEWPLDLFRRKARVALADRQVEAVEQSVADHQRLLTGDVRARYGEAAAAVRELAITENLAMAAQRDLNLRRSRVDVGASPPLERDMLDVDLRMLESERLMAAGKADAAMIELKRVLGLAAHASVKLRETLEILATAPDVQELASAAGDRADVREAEARVRVAEARADQARAEARFDVRLMGSYMRMDTAFSQRGFNSQGVLEPVRGVFHYLAGGAMVMVPLRNRNQGEIIAAQAERAGAAAQLEAARLTAQAEVAAAAARENSARQALAAIEGAVELSRKNLDVVRQTFELGRTTAAEVLAEQRRYLQVENSYTARLRAVFDARTALLRAQGALR